MSAANTDKFLKATRKRAGALDSSGITDAVVDNFGLDSANSLPTDTAISITIDRVDSNGNKTPSKEEEIIGVVSGNRIINSVRGVSGTAQAHSGGSVWEIRLTAEQWNRMVSAMISGHGQDGSHGPTTIIVPTHSATEKTTPVDADEIGLIDSEASNVLKKITWSSIKTALLSFTGTFTNKRITPRVGTVASSATPSINTDTIDFFTITALAAAITSMTSGLTGTPTEGQKLIIRIKDNGTARAITWGASFVSRGGTLPTTTVISKVTTVGLIYDAIASVWGCAAVSQEV